MRILIQLSILIILSGCAALEGPGVKPEQISVTEGSSPRSFQLHDVPHNPRKQKGTDCAPDSLRMILSYRGKKVGEADITRQLSARGQGGGTSFYQMQEIAAKSYGLPAFVIPNCDLSSLKAAILNKWPPVISYRASGKYYHAVVAVGYDDDKRLMFVHDPNILSVKKMRYSDLGGMSKDEIQRVSCLLILPEGLNEEILRQCLGKYVPKDLISKLIISSMIPLLDK